MYINKIIDHQKQFGLASFRRNLKLEKASLKKLKVSIFSIFFRFK